MHRWSILITVQRDATQSSLFIILQIHSTCFGCQPHPSSGLHKIVTTASGTVQLPPSNDTGDCSYSFVYSWSWVWLTLETCRVNLQNNFFLLPPMPPLVLLDFVVLPPGHGRSVTDFWRWDAHEAQLRCPDDVSGDRGRCRARRALEPKFF